LTIPGREKNLDLRLEGRKEGRKEE